MGILAGTQINNHSKYPQVRNNSSATLAMVKRLLAEVLKLISRTVLPPWISPKYFLLFTKSSRKGPEAPRGWNACYGIKKDKITVYCGQLILIHGDSMKISTKISNTLRYCCPRPVR